MLYNKLKKNNFPKNSQSQMSPIEMFPLSLTEYDRLFIKNQNFQN